jgi:hypothetical protein
MKPELQKMTDLINFKDCIFAQKKVSNFGRYRRLKYGELIHGPSKPKKKIRNSKNFAPEVRNGGLNVQCSSIYWHPPSRREI